VAQLENTAARLGFPRGCGCGSDMGEAYDPDDRMVDGEAVIAIAPGTEAGIRSGH